MVCANRRYRILQSTARAPGAGTQKSRAPVIDWVALAKGFGVPACRAGTDHEFVGGLMRAFAEQGPSLTKPVIG